MQITEEMVEELNETLKNLSCVFRLQFKNDGYASFEIIPANMMFVDSAIINITDEFWITLKEFFERKGITLLYNNTRSIFWALNTR